MRPNIFLIGQALHLAVREAVKMRGSQKMGAARRLAFYYRTVVRMIYAPTLTFHQSLKTLTSQPTSAAEGAELTHEDRRARKYAPKHCVSHNVHRHCEARTPPLVQSASQPVTQLT